MQAGRKIAASLLGIIFLAGCFSIKQPVVAEPVYQSRPLSKWLHDFDDYNLTQEQRAVAVDALRHIGTPAVPFLIDCLSEARMEQFKLAAQKWRSRQESAVFQVPHPPSPRYEALAGLDALGSAAVSALPALEKLLHENPPDPEALYVATRMGSESIPLLTRSLNNQNKLIRLEAGVCLDMMKSHSKVLYPQVPVGSAVPSFDRRICEFHLELLKAAAKVYEVEHPESVLPDQELNFLPSPVMRK